MRYKARVPSQLPVECKIHSVLLIVQAVLGVYHIVHKRRYEEDVVDIGAEGSLRYQ